MRSPGIFSYVNPPAGRSNPTACSNPSTRLATRAELRRGQCLILSENWYDTAFANELNGPLTGDLSR